MNGGLELNMSAVVELCGSVVVLVMKVERERDIGGSTARRSPLPSQSARFTPYRRFSREVGAELDISILH